MKSESTHNASGYRQCGDELQSSAFCVFKNALQSILGKGKAALVCLQLIMAKE